MPVNTAALKTFAPAMRRQLLEAVGRKLDLLLNSQTPDTISTYAKQITELRELEAENREQLLERVAYTWFNRLSALRYLDAKGWHPFGCKVLMPAAEGETQPELLKLMRAGSLPAELKPLTNEARLHCLLDGQIPPAISGADPQGEVYRELVLASCRSYHQLLPELFEGLDDVSELLLPDDLLSEGSIAGGFRCAINDKDCEDVEIIGWLYQFYISEKKDQVIGKVVKSEDIPAATQLFTPNWIVKYMVQNSLGATWLATYPDSPLKGQMEFYIETAEQTPEVQAQLAAITPESLDPEALTLIDPACGSGHILVEAYDLLKAIYLERGYRQRDIPELILTKSLFGLDICPRAAQMAAFSLLMKGREDDRRLLERGIRLNVIALQDSAGLNVERLAASVDLAAAGVNRADVRMLAELFAHATTFGALIQVPAILVNKLHALRRLVDQTSPDLLSAGDMQLLDVLVRQSAILGKRYDVVVANPPYMGSGGMNAAIKEYARTQFPEAKNDLFACFIIRCAMFGAQHVGMVCPFVWMYLSSFAELRRKLSTANTIASLIELETNAFEPAMVTVCTFVVGPYVSQEYRGTYIRLSDFKGAKNQPIRTLEAIRNRTSPWLFESSQSEFDAIPGSPIAYAMPKGLLSMFSSEKPLKANCDAGFGIKTGNNEKFIRQWHEASLARIEFNGTQSCSFSKTWYPCASGGRFRRWYGNRDLIVNYANQGDSIEAHAREFGNSFGFNGKANYFRTGITWPKLTSSSNSFRLTPGDGLFDGVGLSAFFDSSRKQYTALAALNTNAYQRIIDCVAPTFSLTSGDFAKLPFPSRLLDTGVEEIAKELITLAKRDWDTYERSWEFQSSPLFLDGRTKATLEQTYLTFKAEIQDTLSLAGGLETRNNQLLNEIYGIGNEISSEVPLEQLSLTVNPSYRYAGAESEDELWSRFRRDSLAEFLSYILGCMMGRYGTDRPGLILADSRDSQAEQLAAYEENVGKPLSEVQFKPDPDGIIPVLDGEWFEDDIVARTREFLAVTLPESSVAENLRFIEESLGKDLRKYFCSDFYKDHLQTYKKRPIYWMVQSPKKGFACLIYLHRYTKDTLNQVLNNYFRPYLQKLEARLAQLGLDQLNDDLPTRERTAARKEAEKITKVLKECQAWEQDALLPLAQQRIELDLDDGVKVNYLKLQDVLAPIPGLAAKED